jgi:uncharacterized protein YqeY
MTSPLKQKLADDLKASLKSGDKSRCSTLRMIMAAIQNAEIAKRSELEDADVIGILSKEVKQHRESIDSFKQGNRQELVAKEEAELNIIQEYLPQQMTREEIMTAAKQIIEETGAKGPADKGKVMPRIIALCKGKADGREINDIVTELLSS